MSLAVIFALIVGIDIGLILMNIPPVLDSFMALYQVSYVNISILISSLMWTHGLMQIPGGLLVDRLGVRLCLTASLATMGLGNLLSALEANFALAVFGRVICGLGTGLGFVTTMKLTALSVSKERTGTYQAYLGGIIALGSIITYLSFPRLAAVGWQTVFLIPGACSLVLLVILPVLHLAFPSPVHSRPIYPLRLIRTSQPWVFGYLQSLSWGPVVALGNWAPSLLAEAQGNSSSEAFAWVGAIVMAISGVMRILGGPALFKFSPRGIILGSNLLLGLSYGVLFYAKGKTVVLILVALATAFASINFGAIFHVVSVSVPPASLGLMLGLVIFMANLGAFFFTFLFGWFKDLTGTFHWAFAAMTPLFFLGLWVIWFRVAEEDPPTIRQNDLHL
jgi:MFS transporter, NNP family, nitrate/nitrite transporter